MGMYDEIYSDYPLPPPAGLPEALRPLFAQESLERGFQTKDLACLLERYAITREGRLVQLVRTTGALGLSLLARIDGPADDDQVPDVREPVELVDVDFHGRLHVHTLLFADDAGMTDLGGARVRVVGPDFDGEAYSIAYTLKFTDGALVAVEDATATPLRRTR